MVDTIREEEKYGNTGDKFNRFGRGVVTGVETVANLINSALNVSVFHNSFLFIENYYVCTENSIRKQKFF